MLNELENINIGANIEDEFVVRPVTMADIAAATELINTCALAMTGQPDVTESDMANEWGAPGLNLADSLRAVFTDEGQMVAYMEVRDLADLPVNVWVWGRVHPDFEGRGIGSYLMTWAEQRARRAIARVPAEARVTMRSGTLNTHEPGHELFRDLEMELIRHFWSMKIEMTTAPAAAELPEGLAAERPLTIRTLADIQDPLAVYRAMDEAFSDHWGHVHEPEEKGFERWSHFVFEKEDYDPTLWFLVMDGDEIAGISLCWPKTEEDPGMGWVGTLGVRRPWRKRGLGLALLQHSFVEFYRRGQKRVGLGVDAASLTGATHLYEKAGMHAYRQFDVYEKELRPGKDLSLREL